MRNDDIEKRIPEYKKARDAFSEQLNKVTDLQKVLKSYGDMSQAAHHSRVVYEQIRLKNTALIGGARKRLKLLNNR